MKNDTDSKQEIIRDSNKQEIQKKQEIQEKQNEIESQAALSDSLPERPVKNKYNWNLVHNRRNTASMKWDGPLMDEIEGLLPLWVADMDFQTIPEVIEDLHAAVDHGIYGYAIEPEGYLESIQSWMKRRHDFEIEKEWIVPVIGIVPAIQSTITAFTEKGDEVLIFPPVYYPFRQSIEGNGRVCVNSPLINENGKYSINFEQLEELLENHTVKAMILCSPHNPVGRVWKEEELKKLGALAEKYGILVLSDEIHMDLVHKPNVHLPFLKVNPNLSNQTILFTAPSKTFNLAGLQCANLIIPDENLRKEFKRNAFCNGLAAPNLLGMTACKSAYDHGDEWLDELLVQVKANTDYIKEECAKFLPEVKCTKLEGLYLLWMDFRAWNMDARELENWMLHEAKLWLDEGFIFGEEGAGFERINLAAPRKTIEQFMKQLIDARRRTTGS